MNAFQIVATLGLILLATLLTVELRSALIYRRPNGALQRTLSALTRRQDQLRWGLWPQRIASGLRALYTRALRYAEIGGYVHDTHMSQFIPPNACHYVTGTWADAAGAVAGTICRSKSAADNTAVVTIPITLPQNGSSYKGSYVTSIDVYWEVLTLAMDAVTAVINLATLPANGAAFAAVSAQAFTYDTGHDAAAERITLDQHSMKLTLSTPIWLDDDHLLLVQMTFDAGATSALTFFGARANFTLRL